jgi:DNA-binding MarR family transcriptional regulator
MTPTQAKVLDIVRERLDAGLSPSFGEVADACGVTRPTATEAVSRLVEAGYLRRVARRHRSIALADRPDLRAVSSEQLAAELARRGKTFGAIGGYNRPTMARGAVTCAADCCQVPVRRGHLFCRDHWFALPEQLRQRILASFGAKDVEGYEMAVTEARDRLDGSFAQRVVRD